MLVASSTLFAKNIYQKANPSTDDKAISVVAKATVPVIAIVAVALTINGGNSIVALLIMGYSIVTQLFPSRLASLFRNNQITSVGAAAGIIVGVITVGIVVTTKANMANLMPWAPPEVKDINAGFIALTLNVVVTILLSLFSRTLQPSVAKRSI